MEKEKTKKGLKVHLESERKAVQRLFKVVRPLPKRETEDHCESDD